MPIKSWCHTTFLADITHHFLMPVIHALHKKHQISTFFRYILKNVHMLCRPIITEVFVLYKIYKIFCSFDVSFFCHKNLPAKTLFCFIRYKYAVQPLVQRTRFIKNHSHQKALSKQSRISDHARLQRQGCLGRSSSGTFQGNKQERQGTQQQPPAS